MWEFRLKQGLCAKIGNFSAKIRLIFGLHWGKNRLQRCLTKIAFDQKTGLVRYGTLTIVS